MKTLCFIILLCSASLTAQQTIQITTAPPLTWQGKAAFSSFAPAGSLQLEKALITLKNDSIIGLVVSVDMTSLSQENKQLEGHLKDEDFFNVSVFTKASFTLLKPIALQSGTIILDGVMTIKNKTNNEQITAQIDLKTQEIKLNFAHTFNRTNYGITYNSPSIFKRLKENAIADDFTLSGLLNFPYSN